MTIPTAPAIRPVHLDMKVVKMILTDLQTPKPALQDMEGMMIQLMDPQRPGPAHLGMVAMMIHMGRLIRRLVHPGMVATNLLIRATQQQVSSWRK